MSRVCKKCKSSEIEVDRAKGITYCTECGDVLEESIIVSEVQIEEGAGGGCNIVGQFVGANDTRGISIHGLQHSLRESTEITLQNGKRLINEMASQLRLNQHCVDTAFNFYKLAVKRGLTRGRKIRQVIAACIYLVCRTEGTPHMLLDLCDVVHEDSCYISSLGKLAMKFAHLLCIKLPEIDPSLFIPRFAHKLEFGEKTHEVTLTALRLVQRMNRDWMATGRRPSGLCGAALLVAARMYDFNRSLDDIVKVVKIGKTTLRKRMIEFEDTPSSMLTVDEFHRIDLEEEHDPPAYTRSKKFAKIQQVEEMANIQDLEKEIISLQESIECALQRLQKPKGVFAKYAKISEFEEEILGPNKDTTNIELEIQDAEEFLSEEQISLIKSIVEDEANALSKSVANNASLIWNANALRPSLKSLGLCRDSTETRSDEADEDVDGAGEDEHDEIKDNSENEPQTVANSDEIILDEVNKGASTSSQELDVAEVSDELDLTGIDDDEIDTMILSKSEIKTKAKLWLRANKDWLKEQKEKEELKRKLQEESKHIEPKQKRARIRKPKNMTPVANPQEAIERMLQEKRLSSKINYDVLKNLNKDLRKEAN